MTTYMLILPALTLDEDEAEKQGGIDVVATEQAEEPDAEPEDEAPAGDAAQASGTIVSEGEDYTVSVDYGKGSGLTGDTALKADEILNEKGSKKDYKEYREKALEAVKDKTGRSAVSVEMARFFDITLQQNGEEVEPSDPVDVFIDFDEQPKVSGDGDFYIIHFKENKKTGELEAAVLDEEDSGFDVKKNKVRSAAFTADSFSVYAVVYTVDFHWEVDGKTFDFGIPGGGCVTISNIVDAFGLADKSERTTDDFIADIDKVEFSAPELVWVGKVTEDTTVKGLKDKENLEVEYSEDLTKEEIAEINAAGLAAGDWALISMKPFDTEETLTITLKTGEAFEVKVTDAQANPYGLDGKTYSIIAQKSGTTYSMRNAVSSSNSNCLGAYTVNGAMVGTKWTFEWTGTGKEYLIHDENGQYIIIENDKVRLTTNREEALANPITVISKNGHYNFVNKNNYALNIYGYNGFGSWQYNANNSDFSMTLQESSNVNNPGTIVTADTSGLLTINLFDYGPEDQLDKESNNNTNPANAGVNVNHDLKFFSYGKQVGTGINDFTGNASVRQGIVADELGTDKFPYLNTANTDVHSAESLKYLFSSGHNGVTAYNGVNHLFTLDEDGYYHYDSDDNYAYYDPANGNKDFTVYSKTFPEEGADNQHFGVGFFPFDKYNEYYNCIHGKNGFEHWDAHPYGTDKAGHYNHHFGMSIAGNFVMPPGGQYNDKDVTYEFSGDDDMWVYIDGVLILDIGGIHNPAHGKINFTDGSVTVNGVEQMNLKDKYKQVTGKDWDDSDFSNHDFRVFYMERGGMYSNLEVTFNLPLTPVVNTGEFNFDKVSSENESLKLQGAKFGLFTDRGCTEQFKIVGVPFESISDKNGVVTFKNVPYGTYYMKEIGYPTGYQAKTPEEVFTVVVDDSGTTIKNASGTTVTKVTNQPKKIDVEVEKKWENGSAPEGASVEIVLGRYKLVEDPNAQGTGTLVIKDSYTGLPSGAGYHVTYTITGPDGYSNTITKAYTDPDKAIEISVPDLPAGVQYSVTKHVEGISRCNVTNNSGAVTVTVPKKGSVDAQFAQSTISRNAYRVRIYAVNNQNMSTLEMYSENYYPAGSNLSVNISQKESWTWSNRFYFRVTSSAGGSRDFTSDGSYQFTNSLDRDIDLYVSCYTDSGWGKAYSWINDPTISGANPVRASAANRAMMLAKKIVPLTALSQTAPAPTLPTPPKDMIYERDTDYAQDPDKITLTGDPWTGKAEGLDAYNEYGPYVYYVAAVNETGMPAGTSVAITNEVSMDGALQILTVTNTLPDTGSLKIKKTFDGLDVGKLSDAQKDAITFTITGPNDYSRTIKLSEMDSNLEKTIDELATGQYTVVETRPDNSTPSGYRWITTTYSVNGGTTTVSKGMTAEVTVTNTYQKLLTNITLKKVDKQDVNNDSATLLKGASFTITKYTDSNFNVIDTNNDTKWSQTLTDTKLENGEYTLNGIFAFTSLPVGFYRIDESVLPAGYIKPSEDPVFEVRQKSGQEELEIVLYKKEGDTYTEVTSGTTDMARLAAATTLFVGNEPGKPLPHTGGPGTTWIYLLGAMLILGCGIGLVARRRSAM